VRWITAVFFQPFGKSLAFVVTTLDRVCGNQSCGGGRTKQAGIKAPALFVGPNNHFERMSRGDLVFLEGSNHLNGGEATHVTIEISAVWDRVNVRTEKK
jgi:hypothetical protein